MESANNRRHLRSQSSRSYDSYNWGPLSLRSLRPFNAIFFTDAILRAEHDQVSSRRVSKPAGTPRSPTQLVIWPARAQRPPLARDVFGPSPPLASAMARNSARIISRKSMPQCLITFGSAFPFPPRRGAMHITAPQRQPPSDRKRETAGVKILFRLSRNNILPSTITR